MVFVSDVRDPAHLLAEIELHAGSSGVLTALHGR